MTSYKELRERGMRFAVVREDDFLFLTKLKQDNEYSKFADALHHLVEYYKIKEVIK